MSFDLDSDSSRLVREITADEIEFYKEHGWVKLDRLLDPDFARELLRLAQCVYKAAVESAGNDGDQQAQKKSSAWKTSDGVFNRRLAENGSEYSFIADVTREPLPHLVTSKRLAKAAHKLFDRASLTDRKVGVRCGGGGFLLKTGPGGPPTGYHQDQSAGRFDSVGSLMFWVALDELSPDQGTMRFVDRSHRIGALPQPEGKDLLELYPKLVDKPGLSPPMYYAPGDATVHGTFTIHGAPENSTSKPRWAYYQTYASEDCRQYPTEVSKEPYVGTRATDFSLTYDERMPVVYRPL